MASLRSAAPASLAGSNRDSNSRTSSRAMLAFERSTRSMYSWLNVMFACRRYLA